MDFQRHLPACKLALREFVADYIYKHNVPIEKLKTDDRIVSRIYEDSVPVIMPEVSIRRKKADKYRSEFLRQILKEKEPAASGQALPDSDK